MKIIDRLLLTGVVLGAMASAWWVSHSAHQRRLVKRQLNGRFAL